MKNIVDYIVKTFSIDNNTSATLVITLSIFILGYFLNWINYFVVNIRTRRNYRKIFEAITDSIIAGVNLQANNFIKASEVFNIDNQSDYFMQTVTITHLDNVDRLDFKLIYDSYFLGIENFFSKRKLKAFNKAFGRLSLIKNTEVRISDELSHFILKFNEHEGKFNEAAEQVRQFYDQVHAQTDGREFPARVADYYTRMDRAILRWQNFENKTEYAIIKSELIDSLLELNREFEDNPLTLNFNTLLLNVSHHFDNMDKTLNVYSEIFRNHSLTYRSARRTIKIAIEILKTPAFILFLDAIIKLPVKSISSVKRRFRRWRK